MALSDEQREQINQSLFQGNLIAAIKVYREATGSDLKTSRDFILELEKSLRAEHPERFQFAQRSGCLGVILLAIIGCWQYWYT
jgi:hypothetical protein